MRSLLVVVLCLLAAACGPFKARRAAHQRPAAVAVHGAGATFPASLYDQWALDYRAASGVAVNYQAIGSGAGIHQMEVSTLDFGGTDKPLTTAELDRYGLMQFPTVLGGVVPVVNLPGVAPGALTLDGPTLAGIYLGEIRRWNDPRIAALNPGVRLPGIPISVVHRSDGSGATFLFTRYLSGQSPAWARSVGAGDSVRWPTGGIGGKGNDGVAGYVRQAAYSIGYVEYTYARINRMTWTGLRNRAGKVVRPTPAAFAAAAARADWKAAPGFYLLLLDEPAAEAWPITGATFVLVHRNQGAGAAGRTMRFFDWAMTNGDAAAARLDYAPLPPEVKALVRQAWRDHGLTSPSAAR